MKHDLRAESYEQFLQRFLNAIRLIAGNKNIDNAHRLITDIQKEWQRRRACGDAELLKRSGISFRTRGMRFGLSNPPSKVVEK